MRDTPERDTETWPRLRELVERIAANPEAAALLDDITSTGYVWSEVRKMADGLERTLDRARELESTVERLRAQVVVLRRWAWSGATAAARLRGDGEAQAVLDRINAGEYGPLDGGV